VFYRRILTALIAAPEWKLEECIINSASSHADNVSATGLGVHVSRDLVNNRARVRIAASFSNLQTALPFTNSLVGPAPHLVSSGMVDVMGVRLGRCVNGAIHVINATGSSIVKVVNTNAWVGELTMSVNNNNRFGVNAVMECMFPLNPAISNR
jgi:hypothetical protein